MSIQRQTGGSTGKTGRLHTEIQQPRAKSEGPSFGSKTVQKGESAGFFAKIGEHLDNILSMIGKSLSERKSTPAEKKTGNTHNLSLKKPEVGKSPKPRATTTVGETTNQPGRPLLERHMAMAATTATEGPTEAVSKTTGTLFGRSIENTDSTEGRSAETKDANSRKSPLSTRFAEQGEKKTE